MTALKMCHQSHTCKVQSRNLDWVTRTRTLRDPESNHPRKVATLTQKISSI